MSVKCLTTMEKDYVVFLYQTKKMTLKHISKLMVVSPRTVQRVLIERGLATPVARVKGEAYQAIKLLHKYKVDIKDLESILNSQAGRQLSLV